MSRVPQVIPFNQAGSVFRPVEVHAPGLVRTARMVLRAMRESDRAEFVRVVRASREHLMRFSCLHRAGETDEQLFARQLEMARVGDDRGTSWRRIGVLEDGRIAGCFNLNSITRGLTFEADANWWVSAEVARQGLGTEGVSAMLDYALADLPGGLGLHKVVAAIMPGNVAGQQLARKVGLRREAAAKVSIRIGERWEFHDLYQRSVLDAGVGQGIAC